MIAGRPACPLAGLLGWLLAASAIADPLDATKVWDLIAHNACSAAREQIETSSDAADFMATPEGHCLYAKTLCCSPASQVNSDDIANALAHIVAARDGFAPLSPSMAAWLDDAKAQCEQTRLAAADPDVMDQGELLNASTEVIRIRSRYSGKVMSECGGGNLSPALVPQHGASERPDWEYVAPRPGNVDLAPNAEYLAALKTSYLGKHPKVSVCAPFVAISDSQDPARICGAARRFTDYFSDTFSARRPPAWVALIHYAPGDDRLYEHARRTTGNIGCQGVLGYFDWQRQAVVFRAPPGFFGTLQHELVHALMFWDMPLAPRWFDEGLAALHEHTDRDYRGLPNPWRQKVLERAHVDRVTFMRLQEDVLPLSLLEFELGPAPATLAREYLRQVQRCGDLAGLYRAVKADAQRRSQVKADQVPPHQRPREETVGRWTETTGRFAPAADCAID